VKGETQSFRHLAENESPRAASYLETLGLYAFSPRATALDTLGASVADSVEVQYIDPAKSPVVKAPRPEGKNKKRGRTLRSPSRGNPQEDQSAIN
jgi:hypothetical protein